MVGLWPRHLHLMAGTHDIAGNAGPTTLRDYLDCVVAMHDPAALHEIRCILAPPFPTPLIPWKPELGDVSARFEHVRDWLRGTATQRGLVRAKYAPPLHDSRGAAREGLLCDGAHPSASGHRAMRPIADVEDDHGRRLYGSMADAMPGKATALDPVSFLPCFCPRRRPVCAAPLRLGSRAIV